MAAQNSICCAPALSSLHDPRRGFAPRMSQSPFSMPIHIEVTAFNIGGIDVPEVKAMMELYPIGQIFDNHVYPGVLHNAFIDVGIPSFTPEVGAGRVLDH